MHSQLDQKELDILHNACVEITSEHPHFPIEAAFSGHGLGWRASASCPQRIRIIFGEPRPVHRIQMQFVETEVERTQEFTLQWAAGPGAEWHEMVRQQWAFAPHGSNKEIEDYDRLERRADVGIEPEGRALAGEESIWPATAQQPDSRRRGLAFHRSILFTRLRSLDSLTAQSTRRG